MSTKDAHTFTDGPTIFPADDVEKIATFCLKSAKIPSAVTNLEETIEKNNEMMEQIAELDKLSLKKVQPKPSLGLKTDVNEQRSGGQDCLKETDEVKLLKKHSEIV